MQTIKVELADRSYTVTIGSGVLGTNQSVIQVPAGGTALIVSNETVAPLYLQSVRDSLADVKSHTLILPDGERFKTSEIWSG